MNLAQITVYSHFVLWVCGGDGVFCQQLAFCKEKETLCLQDHKFGPVNVFQYIQTCYIYSNNDKFSILLQLCLSQNKNSNYYCYGITIVFLTFFKSPSVLIYFFLIHLFLTYHMFYVLGLLQPSKLCLATQTEQVKRFQIKLGLNFNGRFSLLFSNKQICRVQKL